VAKHTINPHGFGSEFEKEVNRLMQQLSSQRYATTSNSRIAPLIGIKAKDIIKMDMLDVATTKYRSKPNKTILTIPPSVKIEPIKLNGSLSGFKFKRLHL